MITIRTATTRWSLQNGRGVGVAVAFCLAIILHLGNEVQFDLLELLAIVLPALEVVMFAAVFAIYLDDADSAREPDGHETAGTHSAEAMVAWFAVVFALIWGNIALMRLAIEAYAALGVPPVWVAPL